MACITRNHIFFDLLNNSNGLKIFIVSRILSHERSNLSFLGARNSSTAASPEKLSEPNNPPVKRISRAMEAYLKRAKDYEEFIKQEQEAYVKGKNFLARIMGKNANNFSQEDVDEAIEYLFPSFLYDKKARPCFKSPDILYKKQKEAQFDYTGRPHHFLFYTSKPNFSQMLHDCANYLEKMSKKLSELGPDSLPPKKRINLIGYKWLTKQQLEEMLLERLLDADYDTFLECMTRLTEHPYSFEAADFILKYCTISSQQKTGEVLPPKEMISEGVYAVTVDSRKKKTKATVTVISPGTGKIIINDLDMIDFFSGLEARHQVCIFNWLHSATFLPNDFTNFKDAGSTTTDKITCIL